MYKMLCVTCYKYYIICREREAHAIQLAALGEEMDHQLAKAEARAKIEARQEAQKQMDTERKKISVEMESKLGDLTAQMRTFEKVKLFHNDLHNCLIN